MKKKNKKKKKKDDTDSIQALMIQRPTGMKDFYNERTEYVTQNNESFYEISKA